MSAERLFQRVIDAHGGDERWRRVRALQVDVRCGGAALVARFQGNAYRRFRAVVEPRTPKVRFTPFKGKHGIFTPERVWIETDHGAVCQERANPRQFFPSWRRHICWDAMDVLYFGGYAMWNYLCTPYLWHAEGIQLAEGEPWEEAGETWRSPSSTGRTPGSPTGWLPTGPSSAWSPRATSSPRARSSTASTATRAST